VTSATCPIGHTGGGFPFDGFVFIDNFEFALRADNPKAKDAADE
jgi:hypothetical protein